MYIPRSGRKCREKKFVVFFNYGVRPGECGSVTASSMEKAVLRAYEKYGAQTVARLEADCEHARNTIKAYRLKEA